jgi:uncharacterized membrane protein
MSEQVAGVGLMVAAFTQEKAGKAALKAMKQAKKDRKIYFDAAAVITQDADGDVHYSETDDMSTGKGAKWGALVGGVLGVLGGPAGVVAAAGAGALIGGAASHGDAGFSDDSLKQLGTAMSPGTSAVITISNKDFLKDVHKEHKQEEMRAIVSKLAEEISAELSAGRDIALSLIITEDGIILQEVAADHDTMQVMAAGISDAGLVVAETDIIVEEDTDETKEA